MIIYPWFLTLASSSAYQMPSWPQFRPAPSLWEAQQGVYFMPWLKFNPLMPTMPRCYRRSILTSSITIWCAAAMTKVLFNLSTYQSTPPLQVRHNHCSSVLTILGYCAGTPTHIIRIITNVIFMFLDTRYLEGWDQEAIWEVITEVNSMKCICSSLSTPGHCHLALPP